MLRVQTAEFNVRYDRACYLPLATGLLRAYAERQPEIKDSYEFGPFLYRVDTLKNILKAYERPVDVAAFSVAVWNEQLNLAVAREVKWRWPKSLIVFGGLQVPDDATEYLQKYPFIDVAVRRTGELPFAEILRQNLNGRDFSKIPQVTYRVGGDVICNPDNNAFNRNLDDLPSPALDGLFDELMVLHGQEVEFSFTLETNRGCPFACSFCEYGLGQHKLSFYEIDRVLGEIEWIGRNKIPYCLGADANFGMVQRDYEIAEALVAAKEKYGYPEKFRVNFGKNSGEKVFRVAELLHKADMTKSITLARQSNDSQVLKNIKRSNIKLDTYSELQHRFNDAGIPTYSEFIVGLPGETFESWVKGLDDSFIAGARGQIFMYPLMALPNTEMGRAPYQKEFGIETRRCELAEIHGTVRDQTMVKEFEDLIVGNKSMPISVWRKTLLYSWVFGALHCLKLALYPFIYLYDQHGIKPSQLIETILDWPDRLWIPEFKALNKVIDGTLNDGRPLASQLPDYGELYWDGEEAIFLRMQDRLDEFYADLTHRIMILLGGKIFSTQQLGQVIEYQKMMIPRPSAAPETREFDFNLHEYFSSAFTSNPIALKPTPQCVTTRPLDFFGDRKKFSREICIFGRKSNRILSSAIVI